MLYTFQFLFHTECGLSRFIRYDLVIIKKNILIQPVNLPNNYTKIFVLVHLFDWFPVEIYIERFFRTEAHRFGFNFVDYDFVIGTEFQQAIQLLLKTSSTIGE